MTEAARKPEKRQLVKPKQDNSSERDKSLSNKSPGSYSFKSHTGVVRDINRHKSHGSLLSPVFAT
jgi:hypothetical protein